MNLDAPVAVVAWERPARFLALPFDIDLRVTAALNGPLADAVVVTAPGDEPWTLHMAAGLRLRTLSEVIKKPLLLWVRADTILLPAASARRWVWMPYSCRRKDRRPPIVSPIIWVTCTMPCTRKHRCG